MTKWRREMISSYIEAAQWSSVYYACDCGNDQVDCECWDPAPMSDLELARGEKFRMGIRLARWAKGFKPALDRAADLLETPQFSGWELVGHNVWLSQVGHGTGFWDREPLEVCAYHDVEVVNKQCPSCGAKHTLGTHLTDASRLLGECADGYIGDDGQGYFEGFAS